MFDQTRLARPRDFGVLLCLGAMVWGHAEAQTGYFTPEERTRLVAYWNEPGRYTQTHPPTAKRDGLWQPRMTAEGSLWLWKYNQARGLGKVPPGADPKPQNKEQELWETWIDGKVAYDLWHAADTAQKSNAAMLGSKGRPADAPPHPGPIPAKLAELVGNPPLFARAVIPMGHRVQFEEGLVLEYSDQTPVRTRYAYYRFPQGVMAGGTSLKRFPEQELAGLMRDAGLSDEEIRVMKAVSLLEGGFDSLNTYDTGFLSVGFIQFAALSTGSGSLGLLLKRLKTEEPKGFDADFRRYGIEVTEAGQLVILDPATGLELIGAEAVLQIVEDKRLAAVFQRAGQKCRIFQILQLRVAREQYYPADDELRVPGPRGEIRGKVRDFIRSEAGLAVLMDRKVNTGRIDPLAAVLARFAKEKNLREPKDFAPFEREIVEALRYRKDYLADSSLTQPGQQRLEAQREGANENSRHRNGRGGRP